MSFSLPSIVKYNGLLRVTEYDRRFEETVVNVRLAEKA